MGLTCPSIKSVRRQLGRLIGDEQAVKSVGEKWRVAEVEDFRMAEWE